MIYWSKRGPAAEDWSVESVKLLDRRGQFAAYRVLLRPDRGREYVQAPEPMGRRVSAPESPLCLIEAEAASMVRLTFRLRSESHGTLRQKRRMTLEVHD